MLAQQASTAPASTSATFPTPGNATDTINKIRKKHVTQVKLDWEQLKIVVAKPDGKKDATTTAWQIKWWRRILKTDATGEVADQIPKSEQSNRPDVNFVHERIAEAIYSTGTTGRTAAEDIAQVAKQWIAQAPPSTLTGYEKLVLEPLFEEVSTEMRKVDAKGKKSYDHLPYALTREDGGRSFVLKSEHFDLLLCGGVPPTTDDKACRPPIKVEEEANALNQTLERYHSTFEKILQDDLDSAWSSSHGIIASFVQQQTLQSRLLAEDFASRKAKFEKKHAVELRPFEEFWAAKTEKWKKKSKKSNGPDEAGALAEIDALFETYLENTKTALFAYENDVCQPSIKELQTSVERFIDDCQKEIATAKDVVDSTSQIKLKAMLEGLLKQITGLIREFSEEELRWSSAMQCKLDDLRTEYRDQSAANIWGRIEKCNNRDFKRRIKDIEQENSKRRATFSGRLNESNISKDIRIAFLTVVTPCLEAGQRLERRAIEAYHDSLRKDPTMQNLAEKRSTILREYQDALKRGHADFSTAVAAVLLDEMDRSLSEGAWRSIGVRSRRDIEAAKTILAADAAVLAAMAAQGTKEDTSAATTDAKKKKNKKKKKKASTEELDAGKTDGTSKEPEEAGDDGKTPSPVIAAREAAEANGADVPFAAQAVRDYTKNVNRVKETESTIGSKAVNGNDDTKSANSVKEDTPNTEESHSSPTRTSESTRPKPAIPIEPIIDLDLTNPDTIRLHSHSFEPSILNMALQAATSAQPPGLPTHQPTWMPGPHHPPMPFAPPMGQFSPMPAARGPSHPGVIGTPPPQMQSQLGDRELIALREENKALRADNYRLQQELMSLNQQAFQRIDALTKDNFSLRAMLDKSARSQQQHPPKQTENGSNNNTAADTHHANNGPNNAAKTWRRNNASHVKCANCMGAGHVLWDAGACGG
ncbi:uncharacterized protein EV422DRAFT_503264 [Fimicolochytrium jonesii]|uniref:uncharacterized protein n=1 Tax=Fimicolochytrium jonesii TaxID=1396493 RepID=UPI0022FE105B|nr:uncharacterized protein EV422DRAFT_503264 [Fimicolochytrium jonesii]KAI8825911.1 hypothetical protein EV422DRAFT_503264 [Fimicolochytrium jonesii]